MNIIDIIRALQRPIVIFLVIGTIAGLAIHLVLKYGDAGMARDVVIFILGAGGVITGFLFGERARTPKD